ncbi:MAG: tRNA (adenosine(37)-N6)-threonylcarbamoyltransferase complex transferase subunit TsaD [bacterium]|nr:tRNA (adenosine(37)-N6)-threonylcarbamoyltransferase complex transferase subunit TsaD [bacterium]
MQTSRHILAIETSCDETAAAVLVFSKTKSPSLISSIVSSQVKLHAKFGGVVPMLAAREQQKNIEPVIAEALRTARVNLQDIDYFAITRGPGLIPSLHVGVNYARAISFSMQKPLLGINHIEGHIYSNWLSPIRVNPKSKIRNSKQQRSDIQKPISYKLKAKSFPILNLVVSGGHTELILMRGHGKYEIIGETLDDAAGEAFDKVARMLGLPYPGGPALAHMAEKGNPAAFAFPRPMLASKNFNFSFSGLKTAVLYTVQQMNKKQITNSKTDICASFEQAVVDTLTTKTIRAAKLYGARGIFMAGGVSANKKLRKELSEQVIKELPGVAYRHPDLAYTGDNAAMIAMAAYWHILRGTKQPPEVTADANLRIV